MTLRIYVAAFALLFSTAGIFGQTNNNTAAGGGGKQNVVCAPEFSRLLVGQQVNESKMIEETDKRVKILLRAADFLWKTDEPTARKYFAEAFATADARFKEKGFESKKLGEKGMAHIEVPDYRMQVIAAIAKKDGEWSKRLSEQVLKDFEKDLENKASNRRNEEIHTLLQIALDNVSTNPDLSRYFYRRVMRYPLDGYWFYSLYRLAKDNRPAADALYLELLQNYQHESPRRLLFLSAYPFASERIFGADKFQFSGLPPASLAPNPNLQARFFDVFFARVARFAANPEEINRPAEQHRLPEPAYIVTALQDIEPIVMQNFPQMLERLSAAASQAAAMLSVEMKETIDGRKKLYPNVGMTFEERVERLKKADLEGKLRDYDVINLVFYLKNKESEFEEAARWLGKIKDETARRETENFFYFKRSQAAREDKRFEDARKYALRVEEIEHRAVLFFEIASEKLKLTNEPTTVLETLSEVSQMARKADDSVEKAQVLLGLAAAYEKVNHTIALSELNDAVRVINRLENPDIFADSVFRKIEGKDYGFYSVFSTPGYNLEKSFTEISRNDFELALSHATNLSDRYFRTLAVIAVVKNCMDKNQPKTKAR
jgi:hypothetical protein